LNAIQESTMPFIRTPRGITPPSPGLDREEPTFVPEEDIPPGDSVLPARGERSATREERAPRSPDHE
jgi:hypothetical protein